MSPEERAALKAAVHTARKQRLALSVRGSELCRGCGWPVDDDTNWSCGVCRERVRSRHRHELEKRDARIAHLVELLDERQRALTAMRERLARGSTWTRLRRMVLERDGHQCRECGRLPAALVVYPPGAPQDELVTLCRKCHARRVGMWVYRAEEERLEARRRSWRESKRRAAQRGKAAA